MTDNRTADAPSPDRIRVTDAERAAVAERLRRAHDEGSLDLTEFDERLARLYRSTKTRGDLAALIADLPTTAAPAARTPDRARTLRVLTGAWLSLTVLSFGIWAATVLSTPHDVDPWWLWVLLAPGTVLGTLWATGYGRRER